MIEMMIIAAIVSSVTLRVAGNVAVDGFFAARGQESPRYTRAKARRAPGAASQYWSQVWDDSWKSQLQRHNRRVEKRANRPEKPTATDRWKHGSMVLRFARWNAHNRFKRGWARLDEKRRERATRPRPGQVTVPGMVVPNAPSRPRDEDEFMCRSCGKAPALPGKLWCSSCNPSRPEDGDRPRPEPRVVPDGDGRTDLRFGEDEDDPTGVSSCPECRGTGINQDGEICLSCRDRQEQRNQHYEDQQSGPASGTDNQTSSPLASTTTQEGTTTMTAVTAEVFSLDTALAWTEQSAHQYRAQVSASDADAAYCRKLAQAYREQATATDFSLGSIRGAGVTGPILASIAAAQEKANAAAKDMEDAAAAFVAAQEKAGGAAADMEAAAAGFLAFKPGQEFYDSRPDAPDREFLTAGR